MTEKQHKELVIHRIVSATSEMKLFYFGLPAISYKAGQYITFVFDDQGISHRRSYSLASAPVLQETLYIGVKRIPNGIFSRKLFDRVRTGDVLKISGTGGVFTLPDDPGRYRQMFFFAAGSGIVPVYSLIKELLYSQTQAKAVLIYSNNSVDSTAFHAELSQLQATFPDRLHIEFLFSNSEDLSRARLHADLLVSFLESLATDALENCVYYVCGPEAYMRFCTFVLQGHHIPLENVKKEIFHTNRPANKVEPPDKNAHVVTIQSGGKIHSVVVQYPITILRAAMNAGLDLPFSCEVGRCGNCMAKCLSGNVWMSYNEVLTERELAKGLVLTCTGYPISNNVKLIFE